MYKRKVSMAKLKIDGKYYYITSCSVLENELSSSLKKISLDDSVIIDNEMGFDVINPTTEFKSDLKKMIVNIVAGERYKYYYGDYDKYYISSYGPIKDMYDLLDSKATTEG